MIHYARSLFYTTVYLISCILFIPVFVFARRYPTWDQHQAYIYNNRWLYMTLKPHGSTRISNITLQRRHSILFSCRAQIRHDIGAIGHVILPRLPVSQLRNLITMLLVVALVFLVVLPHLGTLYEDGSHNYYGCVIPTWGCTQAQPGTVEGSIERIFAPLLTSYAQRYSYR